MFFERDGNSTRSHLNYLESENRKTKQIKWLTVQENSYAIFQPTTTSRNASFLESWSSRIRLILYQYDISHGIRFNCPATEVPILIS